MRKVWAHRRRTYIDLFDPAACIAMRAARTLSDAQRAALAVGRRQHTHALCRCCDTEFDKSRLSRDGLCPGCVNDQAELQDDRLGQLRELFAPESAATVFLDCETTGLGQDPALVDELLEVGLVDQAGAPCSTRSSSPSTGMSGPRRKPSTGSRRPTSPTPRRSMRSRRGSRPRSAVSTWS